MCFSETSVPIAPIAQLDVPGNTATDNDDWYIKYFREFQWDNLRYLCKRDELRKMFLVPYVRRRLRSASLTGQYYFAVIAVPILTVINFFCLLLDSNLRDLISSKHFCWRFRFSGMRIRVVERAVSDISRRSIACIFSSKQSRLFFMETLILNMKSLRSVETSDSTQLHIPKDLNPHTHACEWMVSATPLIKNDHRNCMGHLSIILHTGGLWSKRRQTCKFFEN
jgi:hypothetical protein